MNYTIEETENEVIVTFPNPVHSDTVKKAFDHFRSLEIIRDLIEPEHRDFDELAAAALLSDIKRGVGDRTRKMLANNEEFQRLITEEE